ncbi:Anaphase-promoting complex subunit 23 [Perkinsus chesapeaki]|uniref:Anaphase-promoting complex subunit 23 n=1 Tax=Perkinsus chesapeaki TaxID=330153 RepID=A0A7J6LQR0_PERCH|nr:Anaphase-promoting complex subunit 23 [Perkinsus chesapeaki]
MKICPIFIKAALGVVKKRVPDSSSCTDDGDISECPLCEGEGIYRVHGTGQEQSCRMCESTEESPFDDRRETSAPACGVMVNIKQEKDASPMRRLPERLDLRDFSREHLGELACLVRDKGFNIIKAAEAMRNNDYKLYESIMELTKAKEDAEENLARNQAAEESLATRDVEKKMRSKSEKEAFLEGGLEFLETSEQLAGADLWDHLEAVVDFLLDNRDARVALYAYLQERTRAIRWYKVPAQTYFVANMPLVSSIEEFLSSIGKETNKVKEAMYDLPKCGGATPLIFRQFEDARPMVETDEVAVVEAGPDCHIDGPVRVSAACIASPVNRHALHALLISTIVDLSDASLMEPWALVARGEHGRALQSLGRLLKAKKALHYLRNAVRLERIEELPPGGDDLTLSLLVTLVCWAIEGQEARINEEEFRPFDRELVSLIEATVSDKHLGKLDAIAGYHLGHLLEGWWRKHKRILWHGKEGVDVWPEEAMELYKRSIAMAPLLWPAWEGLIRCRMKISEIQLREGALSEENLVRVSAGSMDEFLTSLLVTADEYLSVDEGSNRATISEMAWATACKMAAESGLNAVASSEVPLFRMAARRFQKLSERHPKHYGIALGLAVCLLESGEFDAAAEAFVTLEEEDSVKGADHHAGLLKLLDRRKQLAGLAHRCLRIDQYAPETMFVMAVYHGSCQDSDKAISYYQKAARLYTSNREKAAAMVCVGNERGRYMQQGVASAAIMALREATELDHTSMGAWCGLGRVYEAQGHINYAAYYYRKAVELRPELLVGWRSLGNCCLGMCFDDEAVAWRIFRKNHRVDGNAYKDILPKLGKVYQIKGEDEKAAEAYCEVVEEEEGYA